MRILLAMSLGLLCVVTVPYPVSEAKSQCPANAVRASLAIWPPGTLRQGLIVGAMHPCGRNLECRAGYAKHAGRTCHWV